MKKFSMSFIVIFFVALVVLWGISTSPSMLDKFYGVVVCSLAFHYFYAFIFKTDMFLGGYSVSMEGNSMVRAALFFSSFFVFYLGVIMFFKN